MLIGIISDTHDQTSRTKWAVELLMTSGAEALIHCGDLTGPSIVHLCAELPAYYVFGNCDHDHGALRAAMEATGGTCLGLGGLITLAGRRLGVTHGHSYLAYQQLLEEAPDYLFTGHTHLAECEREGPTCLINPGALERADAWTVGLLDLATDRYESLRIAPSARE